MNIKLNIGDSNELNISNSSEKELNDILTEDLLSYSEDKSQSLANMHQMIDKNKKMITLNNKQKNKNNQKNESSLQLNKSEITISILSGKTINNKEKSLSKKSSTIKEK